MELNRDTPEKKLVSLVKKNNRRAENILYSIYRGKFLAMLHKSKHFRQKGRPIMAEEIDDIVAESLNKMFEKIGQYNSKWAFSTWAHRILINNMIDFLRHPEPIFRKIHDFIVFEPSSSWCTPEEEYIQRDIVHEFWQQAERNIKEKALKIFKLKAEGLSTNDIAKEMKMSYSSIRVILFRERPKLQHIYEHFKY